MLPILLVLLTTPPGEIPMPPGWFPIPPGLDIPVKPQPPQIAAPASVPALQAAKPAGQVFDLPDGLLPSQMILEVPAGVKLWVEEKPTNQTGSRRVFTTDIATITVYRVDLLGPRGLERHQVTVYPGRATTERLELQAQPVQQFRNEPQQFRFERPSRKLFSRWQDAADCEGGS